MCLYIPCKIHTPQEALKLLAVWYKSDYYKGKKTIWFPNKDRIEILVLHKNVTLTWYSGINPDNYIDISPDIYSLVIFNLRKYVNQFSLRGG